VDTKERRTPVRRPVQSAGPDLASGTAASGKNKTRKNRSGFKGAPKKNLVLA